MAMLAMSDRVRMLAISRWAGIAGSYRKVMRFFQTRTGVNTDSINLNSASHTKLRTGRDITIRS
jgi:hypothetical protein